MKKALFALCILAIVVLACGNVVSKITIINKYVAENKIGITTMTTHWLVTQICYTDGSGCERPVQISVSQKEYDKYSIGDPYPKADPTSTPSN